MNAPPPRWSCRPFRPDDRAAVRSICCDTGWLGQPIDPYFQDREVFADFLTGYYTDYEPDSCFVALQDDLVVGYLLGCTRPRQHHHRAWRIALSAALRVALRLTTGCYNRASRSFIRWLILSSTRENPPPVKGAGHFHFNLLPQGRIGRLALELSTSFCALAHARGLRQVYGRMTITPGRRDTKLFERFGFREIERRLVTKYQPHVSTPIYCATLVCDLAQSPLLHPRAQLEVSEFGELEERPR